jgi:hypothetical protein
MFWCLCLCLQEILEVEQVTEENQGMELNAENVDQVRRQQPPAAAAAAAVSPQQQCRHHQR